ncbi:MAG: TetR/AcrR family transcriptional regulator [Gaiellaceae bacterium]
MPRDGAATRERILDAAQVLVLDRGFAATTVDAVLDETELTKGAFFHHFDAKADLAYALLERWSAADAALLEDVMARAERLATDPLQQLLLFVGLFEEADAELASDPGCLYASFCYERQLMDDASRAIVAEAMLRWRHRLVEKLEEVAAVHPPRVEVDLCALADSFGALVEGAYVLARATEDSSIVGAQLRQFRSHVELVFASPDA